MIVRCPRLTCAGLGGDTGKTVISVGLSRAWQKQGHRVTPFKKGPDYIDMGWLNLAAGHPCYNLDLFFMTKDKILSSFTLHTEHADMALIEGNRGLYDGLDVEGSVSTAEIAKLLMSPVILIVDCTKVTRTVAAFVLGCQTFDPEVPLKGVILNKLASPRQEKVIQKSIERYCGIPVLGAIPKRADITFPGRHLGLVPPHEHPLAEEAITTAAETVMEYVDMKGLWQIARNAPELQIMHESHPEREEKSVNIGVIRDSAFHFYYEENLESLKRAGARLIEFSALSDDLPDGIDALYIGGGFPETHAPALTANKKLRLAIKKAADAYLPIYAECGGLMYLGEKLIYKGKSYDMAGVLPIVIGVNEKPQGHGYSILEVDAENPFFQRGLILKGHEFHYSYVIDITEKKDVYFACKAKRGHGIINKMEGLCYKNVLATYTHLHALGTREWVYGILKSTHHRMR
jgi:cobyrinic acid a,c-diamide synthase